MQRHIHRTGPVLPKAYPVKKTAGVEVNDIQIGTLCALESNSGAMQVVPVTAFTWTTDLATTRANFVAQFLGISSGHSDKDSPLDTRDETILMTQDGECEFDCASATYQPGSYLAPKKDTGNALTNTLEAVVDKNLAVAVVSELVTGTRVRGYLLKTLPKRASGVDLDVS